MIGHQQTSIIPFARLVMLLSCLVFSGPAAAESGAGPAQLSELSDATQQQDPVHLWGNVTHGMSKAEAKALNPNTQIKISDNCFADLEFKASKSKVYAVSLNWSAKNKDRYRCVDVVLALLNEKYGDPESDKLAEDNSFGASLASSVNQAFGVNKGTSGTNVVMKRVVSWSSGALSIRMDIDPDVEWDWTVTYQLRQTSTGAL